MWVSASAGSGKTKVLTDRVVRLLLTGAEPEKILCLTFTNAAASEMLDRVYSLLSRWSKISYIDLKAELCALMGRPSKKDEITRARALLSLQLERLDNLNIYTIHSFCQKVLKQFPLEAGIAANFRILDDINRQIFLTSIKQSLLDGLNPEPVVAKMLAIMHEVKLTELLAEILSQRIKFMQMFEKFANLNAYHTYLLKDLNISTEQEIIDFAQGKFAYYASRIAIPQLANMLFACGNNFNSGFSLLKSYFLTQNNQKRKKLLNKSDQAQYPGCQEILLELQDVVFEVLEKLNTYKLLQTSCLLYEFAYLVIDKYEAGKKACNFLDYDDLIYYTYRLFTQSEHKDWILYKLDGGIEHILVDEAQDTSITQWNLILALVGDFVSGESIDQGQKSIFIVGDAKQSIYSFQGAQYEQFNLVKQQIINQLIQARKKYHAVNLSTSYRSASVILETVDQLFSYIKKIDSKLFESQNFSLECNFTQYGGTVEIWPLYNAKESQELFWPIFQPTAEQRLQTLLAKEIALYVKDVLDSKRVLFSTKKTVQPNDFLILLRQRDELATEIVRELKELRIAVSGLDRIDIFQDLSVMDLLAAARFTLFPEDELNLACLLKSPIFGLCDQNLYELAYCRDGNLYNQICNNSKYVAVAQKLEAILLLAVTSKISDFFYILVYGKNNLGKFLEQNGLESVDAINELINLAVKFEAEISSSMHEFITWCKDCHIEFKRDIGSENVVRIMTVHASKGLQAPIVILPDTTSVPRSQEKFLWNNDQCALFQNGANNSCGVYTKFRDLESDKQYKEYLRLLYVAVTRSCEHLIFCGCLSGEKLNEKSWYNIVFQALTPFMDVKQTDRGELFIKESSLARPAILAKSVISKALPLINLDLGDAYAAKKPSLLCVPNSPFDTQDPLVHGQVVHKILEDSFTSRDIGLIFKHYLLKLLPEDYQGNLIANFQKLASQEQFINLYNANIQTEVSILHKGRIARIDLLHINGSSISIIDYKTDKNPSQNLQQVPMGYIEQLSFYQDAVSKIYPTSQVSSQIIWIMNAAFMQIN